MKYLWPFEAMWVDWASRVDQWSGWFQLNGWKYECRLDRGELSKGGHQVLAFYAKRTTIYPSFQSHQKSRSYLKNWFRSPFSIYSKTIFHGASSTQAPWNRTIFLWVNEASNAASLSKSLMESSPTNLRTFTCCSRKYSTKSLLQQF